MKLIGFYGKSGVGKTTLAQYLRGQGWLVQSFASPLRDAAASLFGYWNSAGDSTFAETPLSPKARRILCELGDLARREDPDCFVNHMEMDIDWLPNSVEERSVVIDDVRYPNEAEWIRSKGGVLWRLEKEPRIERTDFATGQRMLVSVGDITEHRTEYALDWYQDWDAVYTRTPESTEADMFAWADKQLKGRGNV